MTQQLLRTAIQRPPQPATVPRPEPGVVFGELLFEVTLASPVIGAVWTVPGWTLRLWPQARLGDATLEARSDRKDSADVAALLSALAEVGIGLLGPVRLRQGYPGGPVTLPGTGSMESEQSCVEPLSSNESA